MGEQTTIVMSSRKRVKRFKDHDLIFIAPIGSDDVSDWCPTHRTLSATVHEMSSAWKTNTHMSTLIQYRVTMIVKTDQTVCIINRSGSSWICFCGR